jgi:hypothetical protein
VIWLYLMPENTVFSKLVINLVMTFCFVCVYIHIGLENSLKILGLIYLSQMKETTWISSQRPLLSCL